jgi:hypothetical protein
MGCTVAQATKNCSDGRAGMGGSGAEEWEGFYNERYD